MATRSGLLFSIIICIVVLGTSCVSTPEVVTTTKDCSQFKNGKFFLRYKDSTGIKIFLINRQDSIQTEIDPKTMKYTKWHVHWVDNCKYELLNAMQASPTQERHGKEIGRTEPTLTEIISWTNDYYIFKIYTNGYPVYSDTVWVDKEAAK